MEDKLKNYIARANKVHNNEYDYSLIKEYKGTMKKYPIKCSTHGVWEVSFDNHVIKKSKCPKCRGFGLNNEEKIKLANKVHDSKYDYSLIKTKILAKNNYDIKCKKCNGVSSKTWDNHYHLKQGCNNRKCSNNTQGRKRRTLESYKEQIDSLNTGYEYDWDSYKGYYNNEFRIKCSKHGWFNQTMSNHLFGQRCPRCNESGGEREINKFLTDNNIIFETQKRFKDCKNKRPLPFDFYIPSLNLCIEYDGELHYKSVEHFGGDEGLVKSKKHDNIKNKYCRDNEIGLIRISYLDFKNIGNILKLIK